MIESARVGGRNGIRVLLVGLLLGGFGTAGTAAVGELIPDFCFSVSKLAGSWIHNYTSFGGESGWDLPDAGGYTCSLVSGSLYLAASAHVGRHHTSLCVPVTGGATYTFAADLLATLAHPDWPVSLELRATGDENCSGSVADPSGLPRFEIESASPDWRHLESGPFEMPPDARSVLLTFTVQNPISLYGANHAHLDNVSLFGEVPADVPEHLYLGGSDEAYVHGDKLGRFAIGASWRAYDGSTGVAHPKRLTADSGILYFFSPANVELTVKVLDACTEEFDHRFWVFIAGMTDVEVETVVRDLWLGTTRTYSNPLGRPFVTITDHESFPCSPPTS